MTFSDRLPTYQRHVSALLVFPLALIVESASAEEGVSQMYSVRMPIQTLVTGEPNHAEE